jgi:uncharacterized membrane protein required for colicin V production
VITWPDLLIIAIALIFALKGWTSGFVSEVGGFIALCAAVWAAIFYPGSLDELVHDTFHLAAGSAHVVGMVAFAILVYIVLMAVAAILARAAKLPVINLANAAGGALVGLGKALLGTWAVLYILLFFPLTTDLRRDLHGSGLVAMVVEPNAQVDDFVRGTIPSFARPFVDPFFERHSV